MLAITVCYNTPELIKRAVISVKTFYPDLEIIVVDGSPEGSPCYCACDWLSSVYDGVTVHHVLRNIGHGKGVQFAIRKTQSKHIIVFDSDIQMMSGCIEDMTVHLKPTDLGIGLVVQVDAAGICEPSGTNYLHPYFCILNRSIYDRLPPIRNHGAPFIDTMQAASEIGIKVRNYDLKEKIQHDWRGTRNINPKWMSEL